MSSYVDILSEIMQSFLYTSLSLRINWICILVRTPLIYYPSQKLVVLLECLTILHGEFSYFLLCEFHVTNSYFNANTYSWEDTRQGSWLQLWMRLDVWITWDPVQPTAVPASQLASSVTTSRRIDWIWIRDAIPQFMLPLQRCAWIPITRCSCTS